MIEDYETLKVARAQLKAKAGEKDKGTFAEETEQDLDEENPPQGGDSEQ